MGKIGISEYVIHEDHGLEQSQPGPTTGVKVLPGSVLTDVEVMRVCIQPLYVCEKVSRIFPPSTNTLKLCEWFWQYCLVISLGFFFF